MTILKVYLNKLLFWASVGAILVIASFQFWFLVIGSPFIRGWATKTSNSKSALASSCPYVDASGEDLSLVPERILVPSINMDLPVVSMPLQDGTWKVNHNTANYAQGTSLLNTKEGTVGIYGHDANDDFAPIKGLNKEDKIYLVSGNYVFTFGVIDSTIVNPEEVSVFNPSDEPTLVLVTCEGLLSEKRYIVTARLLEVNRQECNEN